MTVIENANVLLPKAAVIWSKVLNLLQSSVGFPCVVPRNAGTQPPAETCVAFAGRAQGQIQSATQRKQ